MCASPRVLTLVALVALVATAPVASPATIEVKLGESIQAAVDLAEDGDVIVVEGGSVDLIDVLVFGGCLGFELLDYDENVVIDGMSDLTIKAVKGGGDGSWACKPQVDPDGVGNCLTILNSSNITISGLAFVDAGADGIFIGDSTGVTVTGCSFSESALGNQGDDAIHVEGGGQHVFKNNHIEDWSEEGIDLTGSTTGCLVEKNVIDRCPIGIRAGGGAHEITKNTVNGASTAGASLVGSAHELSKNTFENCLDGILIAGNGHKVLKNKIKSAWRNGIESLDTSSSCLIEKNTISDPTQIGLVVAGTSHEALKNKVLDAGTHGAWILGLSHVFEKTKLKEPDGDAVIVDGMNCMISKVSVRAPGGNGFSVLTGGSNTLEKNKVKKAGNHGFRVMSTGNSFIKNRASKSEVFDLFDDAGAGANTYEKNKFKSEAFASP